MPVIPVTSNGKTYALFVCGQPEVKDAKFFTQNTDEFQVGVFERKKGYEVKAHMHPSMERTIHQQSEFLYVEKGRARVSIFDEQWNTLHEQEVAAGDFLVFLAGGHSLVMIEDTRLLEVKQGPYLGDATAKTYR